ncbi:glycosyltransferase family 2 protein [Paenibacillus anaericanus]|uniref:Glycosyltransferase family 2 protein n=1 Tax=Paenibacillus anaericanus TaxID=170367 RepID=A0A433YFI7_9BACL|nr:glycosyltransferase family 2 protein [Paenibacillus anaericanus]RUT48636.1 glycosyltransferase family 2 protein [Paenibacillus anaericanus]
MRQFGLTSIIIPSYNGLHLLTTCIEAIRHHTLEPIEIIIVDNGSSDGTAEYCLREGLILVSLPRNTGFPIACNKGLAIASGDQLLLLNNDVIVSPRWLSNMLLALDSADDVGIVGPVTNYISGRQQVEVTWIGMEGFVEVAERYNVSDPVKWQDVQRIVGMCFLFKRSLLGSIGMLDERFSPGHYEDDDYCYRARQQGYRLLISGDTLVYHAGSASFKVNFPDGWNSLMERNRELFIAKWGVNPLQFI